MVLPIETAQLHAGLAETYMRRAPRDSPTVTEEKERERKRGTVSLL